MEEDIASLQANLRDIEARIKGMYKEVSLQKRGYCLDAMMDHEGGAQQGHYWAYVHYKCIACEFITELESDLTKHYERQHINNSKNQCDKGDQFQCNKCKDIFNEKKYLDAHVKSYHTVQLKEFNCKACKHISMSQAELSKHYEDNHINTGRSTNVNNQSEKVRCKNGVSCSYFKAGRCNYKHDQPTTNEAWKTFQPRRQVEKTRPVVHHQDSAHKKDACTNGPTCGWNKSI